jgi:hypothetical protein
MGTVKPGPYWRPYYYEDGKICCANVECRFLPHGHFSRFLPPYSDLPDAEVGYTEPAPAVGEVRVIDPVTGGQKGVKPERLDLIPFDALEEVGRVYGFGAGKYEDDNWLKGYKWRLSAGAMLRHVSRWMLGERNDKESGCHHLAHAAWHCLTLITFEIRGLGTDDRKKP